MSLIKASYTVHRSKAYAGMLADTSLYNVDGTCCAGNFTLKVGVFVSVDEDEGVVNGHKVLSGVIEADKPIVGLVIMSHAYSPAGVYDEGSAVNVLTHGRAWALCQKDMVAADFAFGKQVFVGANGEIVKATAAEAIATPYTFTGEWLKSDDQYSDIVKVQLTQTQFVAPAAAPIP